MRSHTTLLIILLLVTTLLQAQDTSVDKLFYQAVYAEQIDGDLDKARSLYEQILKAKPDDRVILAKALYRLGLITEKDGAKKALGYYIKVVEEFPEQKDLIELVQARVDKLESANTFIDPRDGHKYKWVKIGNQTWMAENLAYMPHVNPVKKQEYGIWVYDYNGHDVAEAKATENYQKYGCLYDWTMAMDIDTKYLEEPWNGDPENHQGICPDGWHLPSDDEWIELGLSLGGKYENLKGEAEAFYIGTAMIADQLKSTYDWNSEGYGTNTSGFNVLPAGGRWLSWKELIFEQLNTTGAFWCANQFQDKEWDERLVHLSSFARFLCNLHQSEPSNRLLKFPNLRGSGLSVRCIKNSEEKTIPVEIKTKLEQDNPQKTIVNNIKYKRIESPILANFHQSSKVKLVTQVSKEKFIFWDITKKQLCCVADKKVLWEIDADVPGSSGNITTNGDIVVYSDNEYTYGVKALTGKLAWKIKLDTPRTSPLTVNNQCFIKTKGSKLLSVDISNGNILWTYKGPENFGMSDPVVSQSDLYISFVGRNSDLHSKKHPLLASIDLEKGLEDWIFEGTGETNIYAPALINNIVVFANHWNQYTYAIDKKTGSLKWRYYTDVSVLDRVTVSDDLIVISDFTRSSGKGQIYGLSSDGKLMWQKDIGSEGKKFRHYQPKIHRDKIFVSSNLGLLVFDLTTGTNLGLIELPLANWVFTPIFSDDRIIIGSQNGLYILEYPDFD